jgi:hypothetical protein
MGKHKMVTTSYRIRQFEYHYVYRFGVPKMATNTMCIPNVNFATIIGKGIFLFSEMTYGSIVSSLVNNATSSNQHFKAVVQSAYSPFCILQPHYAQPL